MAQTVKQQDHVLETLPTEIRIAILSHVDSFASLESCIFRFPTFHEAFQASERHILFRVYSNALAEEVCEAAMSVWYAERLQASDLRKFTSRMLVKEYFGNKTTWIDMG